VRKPVSVNSGNISSDECQFVVLAGRTSGSICAGSFWRSEHERQVPKDFYRVARLARYGFVWLRLSLYSYSLLDSCTRVSPSLYDRIKNNFVSLADSPRKKSEEEARPHDDRRRNRIFSQAEDTSLHHTANSFFLMLFTIMRFKQLRDPFLEISK